MTLTYKNNKETSFDVLKTKYTTNPQKKDKAFFCAKGDSFMLKNEYRKAVKEYLISLMLDKKNPLALLGLSKAYKNLKEYNKAIKYLQSARNVRGFDSEIYYELGLNYLLKADNVNAQKNFIRTIKLEPENKNAQIKLALTHELAGEKEMAIMVYKTIIERNKEYIPAYSSLASLYIEEEQYQEAINLFYNIVKINKQYYRAYLGLGLCFDKLGNYTKAIRFYKKYIALKPKSQTTKSLVGRIYDIYNSKKWRKSSNANNFKLIKFSQNG